MRKYLVFSLVFFLLFIAQHSTATTLTVSLDGSTSYITIQSAIDTSTDGDTIIVTSGTYVENILISKKNIILRSSDPTSPTVVRNTIIDGSNGGSVVTYEGAVGTTSVLAGFTITQGWGVFYGGGIDGAHTSATIKMNLIYRNRTNNRGAGLADCHGLIENNIIAMNRISGSIGSYMQGGGLDNCDGIIRNTIILFNRISNSHRYTAGYGGGLSKCDGFIINNTIVANEADVTNYSGMPAPITSPSGINGGLYYCLAEIRNNIIWGNYYSGIYLSCNIKLFNCDSPHE